MKKITIIGSGNIGLSLAKGLVKKNYCNAEDITLTRRNVKLMTEEVAAGFNVSDDNTAAIADATIVVLAVLPQQLKKVLEDLAPAVNPERQLFVSVISGVSCADVRKELGENIQVVRAMPNTAIAIGQSMTCVASDQAADENVKEVTTLFETVGAVVVINEDLMTSATALCACGIAFFFGNGQVHFCRLANNSKLQWS